MIINFRPRKVQTLDEFVDARGYGELTIYEVGVNAAVSCYEAILSNLGGSVGRGTTPRAAIIDLAYDLSRRFQVCVDASTTTLPQEADVPSWRLVK